MPRFSMTSSKDSESDTEVRAISSLFCPLPYFTDNFQKQLRNTHDFEWDFKLTFINFTL